MTVSRMFNIGLNGLRSHTESMQVIGDNISNVNTVGYKGARVNFHDVLSRSLVGDGAGIGVQVGSIQRIFSQGALQQTQSPLDMGISGRGMFVMADPREQGPGLMYTRAGQFNMDKDGYITNDLGFRLQGFGVDQASGKAGGRLADIRIPDQALAPKATGSIDVRANLDSRDTVQGAQFDITQPVQTSNFNRTVTVYDSLGASHDVTVYFRKTATAWEWHAIGNGSEIVGGQPNANTEIATGTLGFTSEGLLDTETGNATTVSFVGATPAQALNFDFGDSLTTDRGTGLSGITQFASANTLNGLTQDGYGAGNLDTISVSEEGVVMGHYTNGEQRAIAQVALARFTAQEELGKAGGNLYYETRASGQPIMGTASDGQATVAGGALESSNVDLSQEFVSLIAEQRAFQASSRTVTTADEVLQETVNLKR